MSSLDRIHGTVEESCVSHNKAEVSSLRLRPNIPNLIWMAIPSPHSCPTRCRLLSLVLCSTSFRFPCSAAPLYRLVWDVVLSLCAGDAVQWSARCDSCSAVDRDDAVNCSVEIPVWISACVATDLACPSNRRRGCRLCPTCPRLLPGQLTSFSAFFLIFCYYPSAAAAAAAAATVDFCSIGQFFRNYFRLDCDRVSDRAFPVAAARTWNSLPRHITSAPSMSVFRGRLKAFLFRRSFLWTRYRNFCSASVVTVVIFGHLNSSFYLLIKNESLENHWCWLLEAACVFLLSHIAQPTALK